MASLSEAFLRIDRAAEHIEELQGHIAAYIEANQEFALVKVEGNTATPRYPTRQPSPMLGVRVGEVVYNLRAALDYLVFQLAILDSGEVNLRTQFPIEGAPESFRSRTRPTKRGGPNFLTGVNCTHIAAIEELQPYKGVAWTEVLRDLSNQDKHRTLYLATDIQGRTVINVGGTEEEAKALGGFRMPGDDVSMYFPATLFVVFGDGAPVVESMEKLLSEVRAVLEAFNPDFEGQGPGVPPVVTAFTAALRLDDPNHGSSPSEG